MGVSTDAILVFGIDLNENGYCEEGEHPAFLEELADEDEGGVWEVIFEDVIAKDAGLERGDMDWQEWDKIIGPAKETAGVDLAHHCHSDYPMYILAIAGTEMRARRGFPIGMDALPAISTEQTDKLQDFCKRHSIPWRQPQWLLCSIWW